MCAKGSNCCTSCTGTTPGRAGVLRVVHYPADPDRRVVGTSNGVAELPAARIIAGGDVLGYEQLFTNVAPDGSAQVYRNPGTFGRLVQAGRRH